jgi:histidinol-phosphate aminotransferase
LGAIHALDLQPTPLGDDPLHPRLPERRDLRLFFLTNPNSPLGFSLAPEFVVRLAQHLRGPLVVDEAYADFARSNCMSLVKSVPNVIVTRSLSKSYSLAGLRVGLAVGPVPWIEQMDKVRDHYNLNRIAQAVAREALRDQRYFQETVERIIKTRERLQGRLQRMGLKTMESEANFVFVRFPSEQGASSTYQALLQKGLLVRYFPQKGLMDGLRISIGTDHETDRLLNELQPLVEKAMK